MDELETMWGRHLERIVADKHRIHLPAPGKTRIHQNAYRAGPHLRMLEKTKIDEMLPEKGMEPPNTI